MSKFVLVETISQYRMRYVIEVPLDHNEREFPCSSTGWAEDTVASDDMVELSQKWLGETIVSSQEITHEKIMDLIHEDNSYCAHWSDEQKLKTFTTPIGYKREK